MKQLLLSVIFLTVVTNCFSQNVGIGTNTPKQSALLDLSSSNKGLLLPRMSRTQRMAINTPAKGLLVYDTTVSSFFYYDGGRWFPMYQPNYDSAAIDYSNLATNAVNMVPTWIYPANDTSGFFYDDGGPSGNYSPNCNGGWSIFKNPDDIAIKVVIETLDIEPFYDSLFIYDDYVLVAALTGNQTGTFTRYGSQVDIRFKSNAIQQLSGFKIRWGRIRPNNTEPGPVPSYGWHYVSSKNAVMGGMSVNNNWHPDSVGINSFSFGNGAKAKGITAIAFGNNSQSIGKNSFSVGLNAVATGNDAIAMGRYSIVSADNSVAIGNYSRATSDYAVALGSGNATGNSSFAIGYGTYATTYATTAIGYGTLASNTYATSMGVYTVASGYASTATGFYTKARSDHSFVVGKYNDTTATNRIFEIGNGTGDNARSNAITVLANGNVGIGTTDPGFPLNFNTNPGDKISFWGTSGSHYGIGIQGGLLQIHSNTSSDDIVFGYGSSASFTERMRIKGNGNIGIGTPNPTSPLQFANTFGTKISLYKGTYGDVGLGIYGGELRLQNDVPAGKVSMGVLQTDGSYSELAKAQANGAFAFSIFGSLWVNGTTYTSDERFKQNITPITSPLEKLMQINGVEYEMKTGEFPKNNFQPGRQIGLLAQNVEKIIPEAVNEQNGYKGVDYARLVPLLIESIKELKKEIDELKAKK